MSLRQNERALRGEREVAGDMECVRVIDKLDRARDALGESRELAGPDWQEDYEHACQALESLLKRVRVLEEKLTAARAKCQRATEHASAVICDARAVPHLKAELVRVKEERDDAQEQAKHAYAMGRRSASHSPAKVEAA